MPGRFKRADGTVDTDGKGGVRVVKSVEDVKDSASNMLGHILVTKQTGAVGKEVKRSMSRKAATSIASSTCRC